MKVSAALSSLVSVLEILAASASSINSDLFSQFSETTVLCLCSSFLSLENHSLESGSEI